MEHLALNELIIDTAAQKYVKLFRAGSESDGGTLHLSKKKLR